MEQLRAVDTLAFTRPLLPNKHIEGTMQLHCFADASQDRFRGVHIPDGGAHGGREGIGAGGLPHEAGPD